MTPPPSPLFDRQQINHWLDRALRKGEARAAFLLDHAAKDLSERLGVIKRDFPVCADVATPGPQAASVLAANPAIGQTLRIAPTLASLREGGYAGSALDAERLPLAGASCDLIVSLLALQYANDLPGALIQMRQALKPDGLMIACLFGNETLTELRQALTAAESEILGGAAPRVAPFADVRALGGLLQRAGFALPVADLDRVRARYRDMAALMADLRAMGGANALCARSRKPLRRDVFARAAALYAERFSDPDGRLRATFDIIWLSGWAPHESQRKPLKPGSAAMRLEEALRPPPGG